MTTQTPEALPLEEFFTSTQITRSAAVTHSREVLRGTLPTVKPADIITLAEYIVGSADEVPPRILGTVNVALTTEPARCPLAGTCQPERIVGDVVALDVAGLEALPVGSRVLDIDLDIWERAENGWIMDDGICHYASTELVEEGYAPFTLLNPDVLEARVEPSFVPTFVLDERALHDLPLHSVVVTSGGVPYVKGTSGLWNGPRYKIHAKSLLETGQPLLVAYVAGPSGSLSLTGV